ASNTAASACPPPAGTHPPAPRPPSPAPPTHTAASRSPQTPGSAPDTPGTCSWADAAARPTHTTPAPDAAGRSPAAPPTALRPAPPATSSPALTTPRPAPPPPPPPAPPPAPPGPPIPPPPPPPYPAVEPGDNTHRCPRQARSRAPFVLPSPQPASSAQINPIGAVASFAELGCAGDQAGRRAFSLILPSR